MKEKDYVNVSDLSLLRNIAKLLADVNCPDDPNAHRLRSIKANVSLMIDDISAKVKVSA